MFTPCYEFSCQLGWQNSIRRGIVKRLLKQAAIMGGLEAISRLPADRLFPAAGGRGLIFTMHHVRPKYPSTFDPNAHLEITPDFLDMALTATRQAGLVPVRLEDLPALLADPEDRRRFVCFTLDDGYRDLRMHAAPIFRRHNVPYTVFVTPGFVDRSSTLWWNTAARVLAATDVLRMDFGQGEEVLEAASLRQKFTAFEYICDRFGTGVQPRLTLELDRRAAALGIYPEEVVDQEVMNEYELKALAEDPLVSFGGHTLTHPALSRLPQDIMRHEIGESMKQVATLTGREVLSFAYPYGTTSAASSREFQAAKDAGIRIAVTTRPGMLDRRIMEEQPTAVPRVSLNGLYQKDRYLPALISGVPFKLQRSA
jgi:peptidoglycan/xylan/chitin deacetylase (PgdA/CDA1 family)